MHLDDLYINKTKKPLLCPEEPTINCLSAAISITWAGLLCPCVIKLKIVAESFNSAVSSAGEGWIEAPALQLAVLASSPAPLQSLAAGITSTQDGAESSFTVAFCLLLLQINPASYFFFSSFPCSLSAGRALNCHWILIPSSPFLFVGETQTGTDFLLGDAVQNSWVQNTLDGTFCC